MSGLKQSAILGYLLAGTLVGPNALDLMPNHQAVATIAELGVALLLFTIALEFSWSRLRRIGTIALGGGTLQLLLTGTISASVCIMFGLRGSASVAIGAMIALSSTACVLRLLVSRAEIDSVYGRNALGILLLQDIAVVPLVLLVTLLGSGGSAVQIGWEVGRTLAVTAALVAALYLLLNYFVPMFLGAKEAARNRELPILLAIVTAVGAAWASHWLGLSPALGAFIAGILLSESPFATQIRADISPLRTLFVTLFFSSIGMLGNPAWALEHWALITAVVAAIVLGKAVVLGCVSYLFRCSPGHAIATGVCLAQVGEFSFVLAEVARREQVIDSELFELVITVTIGTLFLTPYLVAAAPKIASIAARLLTRQRQPQNRSDEMFEQPAGKSGHIVIVGFGPAGQRVAETLMRRWKSLIVVVELNTKNSDVAKTYGLQTIIGDATRTEVLEHLRVESAGAVVITVPDPTTARKVVELVRSLAPDTAIIARARYHIHRWQLLLAGAHEVVDEEEEVGRRIALEVRRKLRSAGDKDNQ